MRSLSFLLLLLPLTGCFNNCSRIQCDPIVPSASFRLLDASTGSDFLFGPGARYRPSGLTAYAFYGTDSFTIPLSPNSGLTGTDSTLYMDCGRQPPTDYLRLSPTDIDTIEVEYQASSGHCCSSISVVGSEIQRHRRRAAVSRRF